MITEATPSGLMGELAKLEQHYGEQARLADERAARDRRRDERAERKLKAMQGAPERLVAIALAFLACIDAISTLDYLYWGRSADPRGAAR